MKIDSLYNNQTISELIENAQVSDIKALGHRILDKSWDISELEEDLGTSAMESLLNEIANADHIKITRIYSELKEEDIL
jgi:hypothetical protein